MKYLALDIETTGLDPHNNQIIEFGCILDDLESPIERLPRLEFLVVSSQYTCDPYCCILHTRLWSLLNEAKHLVEELWDLGLSSLEQTFKDGVTRLVTLPEYIPELLGNWTDTKKLTIAGKNAANFDIPFLQRANHTAWNKLGFSHRVLDPGSMYSNPVDGIPSLPAILQTIGITPTQEHRTIGDCLDVIKVVRTKWGIPL